MTRRDRAGRSPRLGTDSVIICSFTTDPTDAPLFRPEIEPSTANGLDAASRLMVDKITTMRQVTARCRAVAAREQSSTAPMVRQAGREAVRVPDRRAWRVVQVQSMAACLPMLAAVQAGQKHSTAMRGMRASVESGQMILTAVRSQSCRRQEPTVAQTVHCGQSGARRAWQGWGGRVGEHAGRGPSAKQTPAPYKCTAIDSVRRTGSG